MNKRMFTVVCAATLAVSLSSFAAAPAAKPAAKPATKTLTDAEYEYQIGGFLVRPTSYKGKIVVVDSQRLLPEAEVRKAIEVFREATEFRLVYAASATGDVVRLMRDFGANVLVQLVDDDSTPALLVAPEDFWAKVNMRKVGTGLKSDLAKRKFLVQRRRKEIIRALLYVCGAASSQYPGNLTNAARQPDVDLMQEALPVDLVDRAIEYLRPVGVTPKVEVCYEEACVEGWAPAPTNDVQRALMKAVRRVPDKPMPIKFDPAKGE